MRIALLAMRSRPRQMGVERKSVTLHQVTVHRCLSSAKPKSILGIARARCRLQLYLAFDETVFNIHSHLESHTLEWRWSACFPTSWNQHRIRANRGLVC